MADRFASLGDTVGAPATRLVAITPHDANDLADIPKALWIGGAGDVALIAAGDTAAVTIAGVQAGRLLPIRAKRVLITGTTATGIVGLL